MDAIDDRGGVSLAAVPEDHCTQLGHEDREPGGEAQQILDPVPATVFSQPMGCKCQSLEIFPPHICMKVAHDVFGVDQKRYGEMMQVEALRGHHLTKGRAGEGGRWKGRVRSKRMKSRQIEPPVWENIIKLGVVLEYC